MEKLICQSCSMPLLNQEDFGSEKDGSINEDYCGYCYKDGRFITDISMIEMIEICVPYVVKDEKLSEENAKKMLEETFPNLKRWMK